YLFLASRWPARAEPGKTWAYKPDVRSSKGGVKITLDSGPGGMKLEGDTLTWDCPADYNLPSVLVRFSAEDAGGQKLTIDVPALPVAERSKLAKLPPFKDK